MDKRTVYPGRSWLVEYGGPMTEHPTYLFASVYQHRDSVDAAKWTVHSTGQEARAGERGDFPAILRLAARPLASGAACGVVVVALDTTREWFGEELRKPCWIVASIIAVDGDWMLWHEAHRWELRGYGTLLDAVQGAANRLTLARCQDRHESVTSSPVVDYCTVCGCDIAAEAKQCPACMAKRTTTG